MGGEPVPWKKHVTYLGVVHSSDGSLEPEIANRIASARVAFKKLKPITSPGLGLRFMRRAFTQSYDSMVYSTLLYGAEVWALSTAQLERLEVFCRRCLRDALPPRMRGDHISNERLMGLFGFSPVSRHVDRRRLRWCGHLARMDDSRTPAIVASAIRERRGAGRAGLKRQSLSGVMGPKGVYSELISKHLTGRPSVKRETFGNTRDSWDKLAEKRGAWRHFVATV
jgi:hypothetical protein